MDVFVSHSHRDKEIVRRLANDLKQLGLTVWIDEDFISHGESLNCRRKLKRDFPNEIHDIQDSKDIYQEVKCVEYDISERVYDTNYSITTG
jgi:hypothetical protein